MIAIIDYGVGNLASVERAMAAIDQPAEITGDPRADCPRRQADSAGGWRVCLLMANLSARGLVEPIQAHVASGRPLLGLCLGLQLLMEESEELAPDGTRPRGLGIFARNGPASARSGQGAPDRLEYSALQSGASQPRPVRRPVRLFRPFLLCGPEDRSLIVAETTYGVTFRRRPRARQRVGLPVPSGEERRGRIWASSARSVRRHDAVIPAIDFLGGTCVRLRQGSYHRGHHLRRRSGGGGRGVCPAGASLIHLVDLDGARAGLPVQADLV